ncbi:TIGR03618 family F420-dependent PPOX class oxidoreductase [Frankia gtarii]|uniref:TIGR03618 family F420-dependent PPOX class oxidoreductase n=1 Tax=Frankia gtarii TaxID=2950102 RepID=UPI0021BE1341|nr:TIGR03618 family F420-dependent PPOX class oxidoreductase [Frankia gtarii]
MLDPEVRRLAQACSDVTLATLMPDGQPHTSIVWAHADDDYLLIGTSTTLQKYRNVVADPRVSVLIIDPDDASRYVEVRGRVAAVDTGAPALELVQTTFGKWTGGPPPPVVLEGAGQRVRLRIAAERVRWKLPR